MMSDLSNCQGDEELSSKVYVTRFAKASQSRENLVSENSISLERHEI